MREGEAALDLSSRLKHALETRDAALPLRRAKSEWMARGNMPFLMLMEPGLTLALRTPFQRMPKETERAKYMHALKGERTNLPYSLEVWAPKRVLDIEWDDTGTVELIGYDPCEWEWVHQSRDSSGADVTPRLVRAA
jgi:hypothetical protein